MLDAYFQALARRAPAQSDLPLADEPPPRLPTAEELRPDLALRNPPTTPPELLGLPPPPSPLHLGGQFADIVNPPTPDALMPQTRFEQEQQDRSNRTAAAVVDAATIAAPFAVPIGGAVTALARGAGALARGAGNLIARSPMATGATAAGAVGATTLAGTGETQPPDPLTAAQASVARLEARIARLRARQAELEKEDGDLRARSERIQQLLKTADPRTANEDVRNLQRELRMGQDDGRLGATTRATIERELQRIETARANARDLLKDLGTDLGREDRRLRGLEREERVRVAEGNIPEWARFARDNNLILSLIGGGLVGPLVRWPTRRAAEGLRTSRVTAGNEALTMGVGDEAGRAANLNAFFTHGGARPPFRVDPTNGPLGFSRNPNQTVADSLYPVGRSWFQAPDIARMTGIALGAGVAYERHETALSELAEARREVNEAANPTQDQLTRMTRAHVNVALARLALGTATTSLGTYPTASAVMRYRSRATPHTNLAEAEVMRLNNLLAVQPGARGTQPWSPPRATDITPNIRPDPSSGSGYRRTSGHYASREEIELHRMMEESRRFSQRR